jgi:uncharacterized protein YjbI with pentapeptide repeats
MLVGALLDGTNCAGARLDHADLTLAAFNGARVADAELSQSRWSKTVWARCDDLASARGLDSVRFGDASSIDLHTLRNCIGRVPVDLLEHCGVRHSELEALRALLTTSAS